MVAPCPPRPGLWLLLLTGCVGELPDEAPKSSIIDGWGLTALTQPDAVLAVISDHSDGWAALHRGDLTAAQASRDPHVVARASRDLAATQLQLQQLLHVAGPALATTWAEHGGLPSGSAVHTWAALVAVDADQDPTALLALAPAPAHPDWARVHGALGSDLPEEGRLAVVADRAAGPIGDCLRAHVAVRADASGGLGAVHAACPQPLLVEAEGTRTLPDPLLLRTRYTTTAEVDLPSEPLAATLFSAAWQPDDLPVPIDGPTAQAFGLASPTSPQAALLQVQALTQTLDTWRSSTDGDGARLAADLDVFDVYRARLVTHWVQARIPDAATAREALRAAHDTESGRTLGPTRPPLTLALEATVAVQAGHVRAALPPLQALAPLSPSIPELPALIELVNDLQVADTLGRAGDSREP